MKAEKTRVFLTGPTGVMGMAGMDEFVRHMNLYSLTVLARKSKKNQKKLKPYIEKGVNVIWGDLLDDNSLEKGINGADIVLHVGGMVSPRADLYPEDTLKVNIQSMEKIVRIVKNIEDNTPNRTVKVVYIGSVAQYGSKLPPNHWGSVNDEQKAAKFDTYALSKIEAEKRLVESGIRKWVSIRQTGILHAGLLRNAGNPVAFHTPINGVLEWITTEDSGRLLERVCRKEVPADFWCKFYNLGGGEPFRLTNIEFERAILKTLGCPPPEKVFEPNWFASDNFHGMWFEDSDYLNDLLHFREPDTFEQALKRLKKKLPLYFRLAPLAPPILIKKVMKRVASQPELGPLWWIKNNDEEKIKAFWGSREAYDRIPGWNGIKDMKLHKGTPKEGKND